MFVKKCKVESCDIESRRKGYCGAHYQRLRNHGDVREDVPIQYKPARYADMFCSADGCNDVRESAGFCHKHYWRLRTYGSTELPEREPGRRVTSQGYVSVYLPDSPMANVSGGVPEHRLVMAGALGRPLEAHENVHHINGIRDDNRIENLELWSTRQPPGQRVEDKVSFAKEILRRYSPESLA